MAYMMTVTKTPPTGSIPYLNLSVRVAGGLEREVHREAGATEDKRPKGSSLPAPTRTESPSELLRFLPVSSGTSNRDLIINSRYSVTCALETGSKSSEDDGNVKKQERNWNRDATDIKNKEFLCVSIPILVSFLLSPYGRSRYRVLWRA